MAFSLQLAEYKIHDHSFALFEPDREAISVSYQEGEISFPYWSQVWPAAIGLAQFIVQQPNFVQGKKVLELAAGLGLPSLVAASMGATTVVASDYAANAVEAMQQTFAYNQLTNTQVRLLDWTALPDALTAEVLLLSDVSYDENLFALQEKTIQSFLDKKTTVMISTPQRLVAKQAIQPLLSFCRHQVEIVVNDQRGATAVSLFILKAYI